MSIISNFSKAGGGGASPFKPSDISYTGDYTVDEVTIDGNDYYLFTFTSTGVFTLNRDSLICDICLCGGGSGGETPTMRDSGHGGNGGIVTTFKGQYLTNAEPYSVVIGAGGSTDAAGGDTSFGAHLVAKGGLKAGDFISYAQEASYYGGSTGGAGGRNGTVPPSQGTTTRPFGSTELDPLGAGGGGGACRDYYLGNYYNGGVGGSDGSKGGASVSGSQYSTLSGGVGGEKGGGTGSASTLNGFTDATAGTYWGAGGGGGAYEFDSTNSNFIKSNGAAGYQGVIMLRVLN